MLYMNIDRTKPISLSRQIYSSVKEDIISGKLKSNEKLPSTREIAKYLNVSRNVVIESYEQLMAEGYIYTVRGSGTFVCAGIQLKRIVNCDKSTVSKKTSFQKKYTVSFRSGIPDLSAIPIKKWGAIYHKIALDATPADFDYQNPSGNYELRKQIANYINRARGVCSSPENIIITCGAAQSFSLLSRLVPKESYALVENPLSKGITHTLASNFVKMKPISLDSNGIKTSELPSDNPPKLIFTTPSHQFPTGVILPAQRRVELIKYAQKNDSFIVEDDYDSEFCFSGNPIQAMQYLAPERVIYVGTFSKTLMPSLRVGYMVLPSSLCEEMKEAKYVADFHSSIFEQKTLASFIESGLFEQHIRKMRCLYLKKRNFLIFCLKNTFGNNVDISGSDAGLHLAASFKNVVFDDRLMQIISDSGIEIACMRTHYIMDDSTKKYHNALIFGYGNTNLSDIEKGVNMLFSILKTK